MNTILKIVTHSVQLITIIACIWYLLKNSSIQPYRYFAFGWIIILAHDLGMVIIGLINPVKNHWVYNIAFPLIQLFSLWFFMLLLQQRKLFIALIFFAVFVSFNLLLWQGATTLNTYSIALGGVLILLLASIKLLRLYKQDTPESIFGDPAFWMCSGFLFYWALATPFFAMYNFLWQTFPGFFTFYFFTVNFFFIIVLNLCIIKSLQCSHNTTKK